MKIARISIYEVDDEEVEGGRCVDSFVLPVEILLSLIGKISTEVCDHCDQPFYYISEDCPVHNFLERLDE